MTIFEEPSRRPLPSPDFGDVSRAAGRGLLAMVPLGSVASELWALLGPPLTQRRDDWWSDLERRLRDLEGCVEGFRFEDLTQNEQFLSATLQASQAALKTHQQEKLEALKNAVVNVALGIEPDTDRQQQFLSLVDRFSKTHLILLRFFKDPAGYFHKRGNPVPNIQVSPKLLVYQLVCDAMPALRQQVRSPSEDRTAASFQFIEQIVGELESLKLVSLERLNETWVVPKFDQKPTPSPIKPLATHLGDDFLAFITEPEEKK